MKLTLIIAAAIALVGCGKYDPSKQPNYLRYETRQYELLSYNPPKHFYVDLKDVQTGQVLTNVRVSKHCNSHRETAIKGKIYNISVYVYRDDRGGERREFVDLRKVFCK